MSLVCYGLQKHIEREYLLIVILLGLISYNEYLLFYVILENNEAFLIIKVKKSNTKMIRFTHNGLKRYYIFYDYYINKLMSGKFVKVTYNGHDYLIEKNKFNEYKILLNLEKSILDINNLSTSEFGYLPIKWGNNFENTKEKSI